MPMGQLAFHRLTCDLLAINLKHGRLFQMQNESDA
jgi:hypothetical protein